MLTILGPTVNMIGGGGQPIWPVNEHENLHFGNEWDVHMNSNYHEANGYGHNLDLLIISH